MKTINIFYTILGLFILSFNSCDEEEFLNEEARDLLTTDNSYIAFEDFEAGVIFLYDRARNISFGHYQDMNHIISMQNGTDIYHDGRSAVKTEHWGDINDVLRIDGKFAKNQWSQFYEIISNANSILTNVEESDLSDSEKQLIKAECRFFRGYSYRYLVYFFGDVPLIIEEIASPRADFIRESKENVLDQVVKDLEFAAENLPDINDVAQDGRVSNLVAEHYLTDIYITIKEFDKAISAASTVIDHPETALMKSRFGTRSDEPGDIYWDLFRRGNQNRSTGNTEAIWVAQMEVNVPGGFLTTTNIHINSKERAFNPATWTLNDPDGLPAQIGNIGDANSGGRGASQGRPTDYFLYDIWESDFDNDIRNSSYNIVRDYIYTNPESEYYGLSGIEYPGSVYLAQDWRWYPWLMKTTTPKNHPPELYLDEETFRLSNSGPTYRDMYWIRLPKTLLLRAEAYFHKGMLTEAAADINVIRERANATPVKRDEVNINYILDETARELALEEPRKMTLMRMNLWVERVRQYNPHNGPQIKDHHSLFPIPLSEIEANIYGELIQNPGYVQ